MSTDALPSYKLVFCLESGILNPSLVKKNLEIFAIAGGSQLVRQSFGFTLVSMAWKVIF